MTAKAQILVVDDKASMLDLFRSILGDRYDLVTADQAPAALRLAMDGDFDVVITDIKMPQMSGLEILSEIKTHRSDVEVIVMTAFGDIAQAVGVMKAGACDYITKPFDPDEMQVVLDKAVEHKRLRDKARRLQRQVEDRYGFENLVGSSPAMQKVYSLVRNVRDSDATVLIQGESGTGKELVARAIHYSSRRAPQPFVAVNCAAIPHELIESELFGHVQGAFSGAAADRRGLMEEADGGTLFLDEVSEMALELQAKITRMIQEREVRPVGGTKSRRVDVRIVAATNVNLEEAVKANRFREDLFYRLHVYPIHLSPLRERPEDIELLIHHFLQRCAKREGRSVPAFAPEALAKIERYDWPGNVRELENLIERAMLLTPGETIPVENLPPSVRNRSAATRTKIDLAVPYKEWVQDHANEIGRHYLVELLKQFKGNVTRAAEQAGMERETLHRLAKRLGIDPGDYR